MPFGDCDLRGPWFDPRWSRDRGESELPGLLSGQAQTARSVDIGSERPFHRDFTKAPQTTPY
jgi:hypothetical protein